MPLKIYKAAEKQYAIGAFDDRGEMLRGGSPTYYRTRKGAEKALAKRKTLY
jgi:hypothetical protein